MVQNTIPPGNPHLPQAHTHVVGAGVADSAGEDDLERLRHELVDDVEGVVAR